MRDPGFDYFYGGESEQFSFYRIPHQLIMGPEFKHVSTDAKLLYGLMLDRMGLSARNGWYDEESRVFIYYPIEEIKEALNCGNDKAVKQGQGKPARIYVKRFTCKDIPPQVEDPPPPRNPDFGKSECNHTYTNQTERSYTHPSIRPEMEKMDWAACRKGVMENICFDQLSVVQSRFRRLDETHIQYVFDSLRRNTTKARNIRAYLLTSLYNAPTTIGQFYQAEVQHDLYGSA